MSDFQIELGPDTTDPISGETENTLAIIAPLLRPAADASAAQVRSWFDASLVAALPLADGSLATERDAATAYAQLGKAENTRRAYRAAVRMWCAWCERRGLSPLPATGPDVAAF
ncbi:MAG: hypothetical protein ACRYG8_53040, partial [Janthinobacterium lividum]